MNMNKCVGKIQTPENKTKKQANKQTNKQKLKQNNNNNKTVAKPLPYDIK